MDLHVIIFCIIIPLLIGWSMDMMLGDPEGLPHPIVFFGKWIAYWEKFLNHGAHLILKGALTAVCSISLTFIIIWFLMKGICHYEFLYIPITSIGVFYCLAGQKLRAVLIFNRRNISDISSDTDLDDIDFYLRQGESSINCAWSLSLRNNVEIIEYTIPNNGYYSFFVQGYRIVNPTYFPQVAITYTLS